MFNRLSSMFGKWFSRASIENPRFDLNDPDSWDELMPNGVMTDAGLKITAQVALKCAPVFQLVSKISGDLAKLPLDLYKRLDGDNRELDKKQSVYRVVRRQANAESPAFNFWRVMFADALLWQKAFAYIRRDNAGRIRELIPLLPDRTEFVRKDGKHFYVTEVNNKLEPLAPEDVFHLRGLSLDGAKPCEMIALARNSIALSLAAEKFASRFFRQGAIMSGVLEIPNTFTKQAKDTLEEGFSKRFAGGEDTWFRVAILRDGAKFHPTQVTPQAAQHHELREDQVRDICRWFNVSPSRAGLSDSVSYNSKSEDNQDYLESTLSPWLESTTAEAWVKLLTTEQQEQDTHYFEHNTLALLRMDAAKRHQIYAIGINSGMYSPDECRTAENYNTRPDGKGNVYVDPAAKFLGKQTGKDKPADDQPTDNKETKQVKDRADDLKRQALRRVVFNVTSRARKKAENPRAFVEWVDGGLQSHRAEWADVVGDDEPKLLNEILEDFRHVATITTDATLAGAVDRVASKYEKVT